MGLHKPQRRDLGGEGPRVAGTPQLSPRFSPVSAGRLAVWLSWESAWQRAQSPGSQTQVGIKQGTPVILGRGGPKIGSRLSQPQNKFKTRDSVPFINKYVSGERGQIVLKIPKNRAGPAWWLTSLIPALEQQKHMELCEFTVGLVYIY